MREIGRQSFGTEDLQELLAIVRADPSHSFETRDAIVEFARDAVDRAKEAMPEWCGFVPEAELALKPYPDFMEITGGGREQPRRSPARALG